MDEREHTLYSSALKSEGGVCGADRTALRIVGYKEPLNLPTPKPVDDQSIYKELEMIKGTTYENRRGLKALKTKRKD